MNGPFFSKKSLTIQFFVWNYREIDSCKVVKNPLFRHFWFRWIEMNVLILLIVLMNLLYFCLKFNVFSGKKLIFWIWVQLMCAHWFKLPICINLIWIKNVEKVDFSQPYMSLLLYRSCASAVLRQKQLKFQLYVVSAL